MMSLVFKPSEHLTPHPRVLPMSTTPGTSLVNNGSWTGSRNGTATTTSSSFPAIITEPVCQWILYSDIKHSRVRFWDLIILIPNALFLMFLLWNLRVTIAKLRNTNSPMFTAFYSLVMSVALISVLRCIVSMTVNASLEPGDIADKVLWLVLRFFLLATELSVIVFGVAFGHLESRKSIQRVLLVTSILALIYSGTQGTLEFVNGGQKLLPNQNYDVFGHGGMVFWMSTSAFFFVAYTVIFILPWTRLKERLNLPSKKSFYYYALFLAVLNFCQAIGSGLLYTGTLNGLCVVDATTYIYFTCFHPLVYGTFLREFFKIAQPSILFSYKYQQDEATEEDTVSLPYQASGEKQHDSTDNISDSGSYNSTHFDKHPTFVPGSLNSDYTPGAINRNDFYHNPKV